MAVPFVVVLAAAALAVPAVAAALVLWLAGRRGSRPGAGGAPPALALARRHETSIAVASAAAAVLTAVAVLRLPLTWTAPWLPAGTPPGVAWSLAPFAAAVACGAVRAAGERTWPRPSGVVRTAPLARRTVRDLGGRRLARLLATSALLALALVATGLTATPDGTAVPHPVRVAADGAVTTGASGPYPGWPYGVPILAGLAVTLLVTVATLRAVARRAPLSGLPRGDDEAVRQTSADRVVAGVQLCVGGATALVLLVTATALAGAATTTTAPDEVARTPALVALALLLGLLAVAAAATSLAGTVTAAAGRVPATAR
ncbi:hypothetical protein [Isoptericola sp. BMS4]|uniref:hypothetical protein n=1 Tax=Isoptericola sp. BMS4 TaxID=2527875 RepID=UPI0014234880|nr:hypothetical protein [Isoptericola sp. BMS4]